MIRFPIRFAAALFALIGAGFSAQVAAVDAAPPQPAATTATSANAAPRRPDIVVFLSDDHTRRDSSLHGALGIATPNMERLAAAGMTFERAYVASPSCAPSRAALLTGLYPAKNGAEPNHSRPRPELKKLPAYLQELGYEVASFGKVGHYAQTPEYGFDVARHFGYHEDIAVPKSLEWLRSRSSDQPLCLFVGTNWPHVPWPEQQGESGDEAVTIPPNHVENEVSRQWRARYVAAVQQMDRELGQVYDVARETLGEDTFFLHTSDHGAQWPFGKWNLYDDGIRTPLVVSWPGHIGAGLRTQAMVSWIDILPTLVDVAGGPPPREIDGRSFLPVLQGKTAAHRAMIFTTHSGDGNHNVYPIRAVTAPDGWKYIRNLRPDFLFKSHVTEARSDNGYWESWLDSALTHPSAKRAVRRYLQRPAEELYDTQNDPWEQHNLISDESQSDRVNQLRANLDEWMASTQDAGAVFGTPQRRPDKGQPNIITILIDDMGWSDLSCFGGTSVETENIDRLAAEGIRFESFYVNSPICSPSRVALTTGTYPQRWRISSYLAHRSLNRERGVAQWLDPSAPSLARQLKHAGYATGHFGKWHMGGQRDVGDAPLIGAYGFDRSLTNFEGLGERVLPLKDTYDGTPPQKHDLGSAQLGKGPIHWEDRSQITRRFVDAAIEFIDHAQVMDQPFYVNVWPDDVHSPFFPSQQSRQATDGSKRARYHAVLDELDQQLARLFERVRGDEKLRNNTLIVLASDNGHEEGAGRSDPLRGAKTWLYEGGIRSPLVVWGPGLVASDAAGTVNTESILCALDVNRSLHTLAGVEPDPSVMSDGEDLCDTLLGRSKQSRQSPIFWRRPPDRAGSAKMDNPDLAARDGKWKLLINHDGSDPQLYDLESDASESSNVIDEHPQVTKKLQAKLVAWNQELPRDAGDPAFDAGESAASEATGPLPAEQFVNPIGEGADPWVIRDPNQDRYLWCMSEGNRAIAIHTSDRLTSLGEKHIVWQAPEDGPYSREVWAPELHFLDDRWHIYFAASDGKNEHHLTYVLRSQSRDPLGPYELHGPMATGEGTDGRSPNIWAIDMTVLDHGGERYAIWSGWDAPGTDRQFLYIAPMKSPVELAGPRVRLCDNDDFEWERTEPGDRGRGLNEGPQVLKSKERTFVIYSCGASWLSSYKLGGLELVGNRPLEPASWRKFKQPLFEGTSETYGIGHSCFVRSLDGNQWWHVFHAKRDREPGWRRGIFVQPMRFGPKGKPLFGEPVAAAVPLPRPSGEELRPLSLPFEVSLDQPSALQSFRYLGHHQFYKITDRGLELGVVPETPINDYRSGEKVVLEALPPANVAVEVTIDFLGNEQSRDAGVLVRTSGAAVGYDAQRGYFAGLIPKTGLVVFGETDGTRWNEIARADIDFDLGQPQRLRVEAVNDSFTVRLNGEQVLTAQDDTYPSGTVGLRVVDSHALFSDLRIESVSPKP